MNIYFSFLNQNIKQIRRHSRHLNVNILAKYILKKIHIHYIILKVILVISFDFRSFEMLFGLAGHSINNIS